jgi:hypothetical protein
MGNAGRHHAPPYAPRPLPPPKPPASEARIAPGQAIRASWNFLGGRGAEIEIKNLGPNACEFEGPTGPHVLRAGKTAVLSVLDNTHEFDLELDSARGTQVRLAVTAWRPAPPPTRTLGTRKLITRDPKTQVITSIVETPVWVVHDEGR